MSPARPGRIKRARQTFAELLLPAVNARGGQRRVRRGVTAKGERLSLDTLSDYLGGNKLPGLDMFDAIAEVLDLPDDEDAALRAAFEAADAIAKRHSIAAAATPKVFFLPDPFPPFSGRRGCFIDDLLTRAFSFAGIALERAPLGGQGQAPFNLRERLERIESGDVHLLVNLVTLARVRKLTFFEFPVRVSLNGVALARPKDAAALNATLESARTRLSGQLTTASAGAAPFELIAIVDEVGQSHILRRIDTLAHEGQGTALPKPIINVETLDHLRLATTLRDAQSDRDKPVILFCDEVTALGVLRALGGHGQLLYPPCAEMSVVASRERRQLPAHILGVGYRRPHGSDEDRRIDTDDGELFGGVLSEFLRLELETTAASLQQLYEAVVEYAYKCLEQSAERYVGGVRKVTPGTLPGGDPGLERCLIDQSARSFARWTLRLSQRAADAYDDRDPWTPVLRRARQRIRLDEARRRDAIREVLKLLIGLAVGGLGGGVPSAAQFKSALKEHHDQFAYLLEREFDVRLPQLAPLASYAAASFEAFLSAFQHALETVSGEPDAMVITPLSKSDAESDPLAIAYDRRLAAAPPDSAERRRYEARRAAVGVKVFGIRHLGESVALGWMVARKPSRELELLDMCVGEHARGSRANQLLLRHVIDHAEKAGLAAVTASIKSIPLDWGPSWFLQMGFQPAGDYLRYQLLVLK